MKVLIHILLSFILAGPLLAQPISSYLDTTYNLDGRSDWFLGMAKQGSSYYISTWSNASGIADFGIAELRSNGSLKTLQIYTDSSTYEAATDIITLSTGRLALAVQYRNRTTGDFQYRMVIVDTHFNIHSSLTYGIDTIYEIPQGICSTKEKIVLTGARNNTVGQDIYIVAIDTGGSFLWEQELGMQTAQHYENSYGIVPTSDGGFMIAGYRQYIGQNRSDWLIIKTDSLGNQEWEKTFGGSGKDFCEGITGLANGEYVAVGFEQKGANIFNARMIRFREDGGIVWDRSYYHPSYEEVLFERVIETKDGDLVALGVVEDDSTNKDHGWLLKTDAQGNTIWSREIRREGHYNHQYLRDLEQTPDGGYLLVGSVFNNPNDAWVVKVDSVGCMVEDCDSIKTGIPPEPIPDDLYLGNPVPNPTTGAVTISYQLPPGTSGQMQVVDIHGRLLQTHAVHASENQLELDLSDLPGGLVFVSLRIGDRQPVTRAVMVE